MNDLESRVQIAGQILKNVLEECDLYIGVDAETKEFIFFDRKTYNKGLAQYARIKMDKINIK